MEIVVTFYDYMGTEIEQILSDWPHYKEGNKIQYKGAEYIVRDTLINLDAAGVYIRAYATNKR